MIKQILNSIIKGWITEYKFDVKRKWRFDYANRELKLAVEIEGGVWNRGRHIRGKGFIADCEKYNQAQLLGWKVLRYTPQQINKMVDDLQKYWEEEKDERFKGKSC